MAEVADCLNTTVPTAKSCVHRARLALRKRLEVFMSAHHLASRWSLKTETGVERGGLPATVVLAG